MKLRLKDVYQEEEFDERKGTDDEENIHKENLECANIESEESDEEYGPKSKNKCPKLFNQESLSDFFRNIVVPKDISEYMAAEFKKRNFLEKNTSSTFYRDREKNFRPFYTTKEDQTLVYCTDVNGLMNELKPNIYKPEDYDSMK